VLFYQFLYNFWWLRYPFVDPFQTMAPTSAEKGKAKATVATTISDGRNYISATASDASDSSDSEVSSDSGSPFSNTSESDSEDDVTPQYLESLIEKARQNARIRAATKAAFGDEDEVIRLENDDE
jgi:hypothetical protein